MDTTPVITTFGVTGMTCGHCVRTVKAAVAGLDGVTDVTVEFRTGTVQVTSTDPLDDEAVRAAVDEAGYGYVA